MKNDIILKKANLTENAKTVLRKRYLKKENGKVVETPEEMFARVAFNIASAERIYKPNITDEEFSEVVSSFYDMMVDLKFLPNSPTLMNAGRDLQQLSACFVIPIEDSMESIFEAVKNAALIHKSGGGTGFSFSRLRPKNDMVKTTGGVASGPVSFMKVFNAATEAVKQGGTRRGANMGILRIDHPDILEFITCKLDNKEITNFNISVAVTEEFMRAVMEDREYELINPRTKRAVEKLRAREVFDKIVECAWHNGEPGIVFIDRINRDNPTPELGEIESTNPCGEQPLLPYESCNLGSINLDKFVILDDKGARFDWDDLAKVTSKAVRFLDNVIDMNNYPLPQIDFKTKANRKIGLGVMGWADALIKLGIPYNSEEALKLAEEVMAFIYTEARAASSLLAKERGPFPNIDKSKYAGKIQLRNSTITTIAPTGTISIIAGCSSGIEPLFAVNYYRQVLDKDKLIEMHPYFVKRAKELNFYSEELMKKIAEQGSIRQIEEIPEEIRRIFVTAHDISPEDHIRMQAAFQKYVDNAVSKTINFPHNATKEDVRKAYLLAYELGCKGITIYRDKSREEQVLNLPTLQPDLSQIKVYFKNVEVNSLSELLKESKGNFEKAFLIKDDNNHEYSIKDLENMGIDVNTLFCNILPIYVYDHLVGKLGKEALPRTRPKVTFGQTVRQKTGCGNLFVTINKDEAGKAFEVFCTMGKSGGCAMSMTEAIGRLISLALRSNIPAEQVYDQLLGVICYRPTGFGKDRILSCSDAIAKALKEALDLKIDNSLGKKFNREDNIVYIQDDFSNNAQLKLGACPGCHGSNIVYDSGCATCIDCGYSDCS